LIKPYSKVYLYRWINSNSLSYLSTHPYTIINKSQFPECKLDGEEKINIDEKYDVYEENKSDDLDQIKYLLYTEGPLLAAVESNITLYSN
jgi:hypothetical protein